MAGPSAAWSTDCSVKTGARRRDPAARPRANLRRSDAVEDHDRASDRSVADRRITFVDLVQRDPLRHAFVEHELPAPVEVKVVRQILPVPDGAHDASLERAAPPQV